MDLQHAPLARLTAPCDLSAADETPSLVHVDGPDPHFGPALMPRAPSAQSHNSCDDAGCRSGRKAKRTKPLSDYARTKAAFMRKIGSCQECRCRKVSCDLSHHNLSLFENEYNNHQEQRRQASEQPSLVREPSPFVYSLYSQSPIPGLDMSSIAPPAVPQYLQTSPSPVPISLSPRPSTSNLRLSSIPNEIHLMGIGSFEQSNPDIHITQPDVGPSQPYQPQQSQPCYPMNIVIDSASHDMEISLSHDGERNSFLPDLDQSVGRAMHQSFNTDRMVPIGKEIQASLWQCQFGNEVNDVGSGASSVNGAKPCGLLFGNLIMLSNHYQTMHLPFYEWDPPFMYECTICQTMNEGVNWCISCYQSMPSTTFYFGAVSQTVTLPNAIPIPNMRKWSRDRIFSPSSGTHTSSMPTGSGNSFMPPHWESRGGLYWTSSQTTGKSYSGLCGRDSSLACFEISQMWRRRMIATLKYRRNIWKAPLLVAACICPIQILCHIAESVLSYLVRSYPQGLLFGLDIVVSLAFMGVVIGVAATLTILRVFEHVSINHCLWNSHKSHWTLFFFGYIPLLHFPLGWLFGVYDTKSWNCLKKQ